MAILIDEHTRVVVQGITGRIGRFHAEEMIDYGTNVVAGVTPGKGGGTVLDRPIFNTMKDAVAETGATASIVFVPPPFAADSLMEAADAGIRFCACITDGIPTQDMMRVKRYMRRYKAQQRMTLTGPNCAGTISPGRSLVGIMPGHIYLPGRVGVIGRSGTLSYEAASQMKALGIGISTSVGIGGDPVNGSSFRDHLTKPVIAYIAGLSAPKGRKMGHAGAIVSAVGESAQEKAEILTAAGVTMAPNPSAMGDTVARVLA